MAKRLISFRELDEVEGLVEHHRKLQERLEALEADAARFDTPAQDSPMLIQKESGLKRDLVALPGRILDRVRK